MKMLRLAGAFVAATLVAGPAHAEPLTPSQTVDAFHFALKSGKRQDALALLVSDVVIFEQGHIEKSRTEYARGHLAEDMSFASSTQRSVSRRSAKLQGNTAWVMSVNRNKGKFNNRPVDFTTDETMVLTRAGGKWRIAHVHWSFDDRTR